MTLPRHITKHVLVTAHALERYRERVADIPPAAIRIALDTPAIRAAAAFGAPYVRLATGQRIVIANGAVVTVLPAEHYRRQIGREGLGRFGHTDKAHRRGMQTEGTR